MELAAGDAIHKALLLFYIRLVQSAFERPRDRELAASLGRAQTRVPGLGSGDADPVVVVRLRVSLGAEKECTCVKGRAVKLRRSETDLDMTRISEDQIEIVPAVPEVRAQFAPSAPHRIIWVAL